MPDDSPFAFLPGPVARPMDEVAERHPAAVMFTDIVGYTALMQDSEDAARAARSRHRNALEPAVAHHQGKVLQYFGDGSLSVFGTTLQAVRAAIAMQDSLRVDPPVPVRIGIHFGDIAYDEQGAYGDSVNVTARIESLAAAGGILVSERVVEELGGEGEVQTALVGEFGLKNVREPVRIYAVVGAGLRVPTADEVHLRVSGSALSSTQTFTAGSGFEIQRFLGEGLLGRVYMARETRLGRTVIVKMMRPDLFKNPIARARFEREARSVARLSHPNLATLLRVGEAEDHIPYLVMEYVKGVSLDEALEAGGRFPPEVGRSALTQIASALAAAHAADIIHRNVKIANVIWDADAERAVLTDFGFARIMDAGDEAHTMMSLVDPVTEATTLSTPEHLMGEPLTPPSDVYQFGVLGYRVLADRNPYEGIHVSSLVASQLSKPPTPLRSLAPDIPLPMAEIIERCLARDPELRPTAQEVADALAHSGGGGDTPPGPEESGPGEGGLKGLFGRLRRR